MPRKASKSISRLVGIFTVAAAIFFVTTNSPQKPPAPPQPHLYSSERLPSISSTQDYRGPGDGPPLSRHPIIDQELRKAWDNLSEALVAYPESTQMRQGVSEILEVRMTLGDLIDDSGLMGDVVVERVLVGSASISARMLGDTSVYEIEALSTEEQALVGEHTEWQWRVKALRSGKYDLRLQVSARIWLSTGEQLSKGVLSEPIRVSVAANPSFIVRDFLEQHWMWLAGSPLLLWLLSWIRKKLAKPRRQAGFLGSSPS